MKSSEINRNQVKSSGIAEIRNLVHENIEWFTPRQGVYRHNSQKIIIGVGIVEPNDKGADKCDYFHLTTLIPLGGGNFIGHFTG